MAWTSEEASVKAAIVSAIYGRFDDPKPPREQAVIETEYVLVTDNPDPVPGWRTVYAPSKLHPRTAAKLPKLFPWRYAEADIYIWIDGAAEVMSHTFVEEATRGTPELAQWPHPDRDCLFDEAQVSLGIGKYTSEGNIKEQVAGYVELGMPDHWGMWATGVIVRRPTRKVKKHSTAWWDEIYRWSYQDQVSESFVSWALDLRPVDLPGHLWSNPWVRWHAHPRGD